MSACATASEILGEDFEEMKLVVPRDRNQLRNSSLGICFKAEPRTLNNGRTDNFSAQPAQLLRKLHYFEFQGDPVISVLAT